MTLTIFSLLYEFLCGTNLNSPEYVDEGIYDGVGWITFICSIVICLIFYLGLGRWKAVFFKVSHWVFTIVLCTIIGFFLAYSMAQKNIGEVDGYLRKFAIINAILAGVIFIIFSFIFKKASIFAKRTPF